MPKRKIRVSVSSKRGNTSVNRCSICTSKEGIFTTVDPDKLVSIYQLFDTDSAKPPESKSICHRCLFKITILEDFKSSVNDKTIADMCPLCGGAPHPDLAINQSFVDQKIQQCHYINHLKQSDKNICGNCYFKLELFDEYKNYVVDTQEDTNDSEITKRIVLATVKMLTDSGLIKVNSKVSKDKKMYSLVAKVDAISNLSRAYKRKLGLDGTPSAKKLKADTLKITEDKNATPNKRNNAATKRSTKIETRTSTNTRPKRGARSKDETDDDTGDSKIDISINEETEVDSKENESVEDDHGENLKSPNKKVPTQEDVKDEESNEEDRISNASKSDNETGITRKPKNQIKIKLFPPKKKGAKNKPQKKDEKVSQKEKVDIEENEDVNIISDKESDEAKMETNEDEVTDENENLEEDLASVPENNGKDENNENSEAGVSQSDDEATENDPNNKNTLSKKLKVKLKKGETLPDTNEDVEKSETETALIAEQDNQEEKGTILTINSEEVKLKITKIEKRQPIKKTKKVDFDLSNVESCADEELSTKDSSSVQEELEAEQERNGDSEQTENTNDKNVESPTKMKDSIEDTKSDLPEKILNDDELQIIDDDDDNSNDQNTEDSNSKSNTDSINKIEQIDSDTNDSCKIIESSLDDGNIAITEKKDSIGLDESLSDKVIDLETSDDSKIISDSDLVDIVKSVETLAGLE